MCPATVFWGMKTSLTMAKAVGQCWLAAVSVFYATDTFVKLLLQLAPQLELGIDISFAAGEAVEQRDSPRELQVLAYMSPCTEPISARTHLRPYLRNPCFPFLKHCSYSKFFLPSFLPQLQPSWHCICDWKHCSWKGLPGVIEGLIFMSHVGTSTRETAGWTICPAALLP